MKKRDIRVNEMIRVSPVRLIGPDGEQVGIVPTREAYQRAQDAGLDLVEVSPNARPPVCRILDYGKYKYNLAKKASDARKKQHSTSIKGMRYRPKTEEHDYQFKLKHVRTFLEQGNKVKCFVLFRGRERAHTEFGQRILDRLIEDLEDIAIIENPPKMEGPSMTMLVSPRPEAVKKRGDDRHKSGKKKRREEKREERGKARDTVVDDAVAADVEDYEEDDTVEFEDEFDVEEDDETEEDYEEN